jgi:hypothetical protein
MTPEQQAQRGERAREILEDPLFRDAFGLVEKELFALWRSSKIGDVAGRERVFNQLACLELVRAKLTQAVSDGRIARETLRDRARRLAAHL